MATLPGPDGELLHLRRRNEAWVVEFDDHLPPAAERQQLLDAYRRLRPILLTVRPLVGRDGETAETIWKQFMKKVDPPSVVNPEDDPLEDE